MLTRFSDVDRTFGLMDELHRRMSRVFEDFDKDWAVSNDEWPLRGRVAFPRVNLVDAQTVLLVEAEVPGLKESDIKIAIDQDVLMLAGERKTDVPDGYSVYRRERVPARFSRSFSLPCKVDAEKTTASLKDGILRITLPKAPEAQPRQIAIKSA